MILWLLKCLLNICNSISSSNIRFLYFDNVYNSLYQKNMQYLCTVEKDLKRSKRPVILCFIHLTVWSMVQKPITRPIVLISINIYIYIYSAQQVHMQGSYSSFSDDLKVIHLAPNYHRQPLSSCSYPILCANIRPVVYMQIPFMMLQFPI